MKNDGYVGKTRKCDNFADFPFSPFPKSTFHRNLICAPTQARQQVGKLICMPEPLDTTAFELAFKGCFIALASNGGRELENLKKFGFAQKTIEIQRCKAGRIEKTEETITITMITLCIGQSSNEKGRKKEEAQRPFLRSACYCCCMPELLFSLSFFACLVTPKCFVLIVSSRPFKDLCRRLFF